jgi:myo-inositol-1(or 4)-monophosphatase
VPPVSRAEDLERVERALDHASRILRGFQPASLAVERKVGGDLVTAADRAVNESLRKSLPGAGEGWLSEETVDDASRLARRRVWVVDPLDGTREFLAGIPEYCISIGLVEEGDAVAGGICNPASGELFVGAVGEGLRLNGRAVRARERRALEGASVLASRSEVGRGEWQRFEDGPFQIRPVGSVAYKLALVAAGLADATWTLTPKHEWDVAAGVALVRAAGGEAFRPDRAQLSFNRPEPLLTGLAACAPGLATALRDLLV